MANDIRDLLGNGLLAPLRRLAGTDYVSGNGEVLVDSAVQQVLKTARGDLPWRPGYGGSLDRFRNRSMSDTLLMEVEAQVIAAITEFEPRARVDRVKATRNGTRMLVQLTWSIVPPQHTQRSQVLLGPFTTEITI